MHTHESTCASPALSYRFSSPPCVEFTETLFGGSSLRLEQKVGSQRAWDSRLNKMDGIATEEAGKKMGKEEGKEEGKEKGRRRGGNYPTWRSALISATRPMSSIALSSSSLSSSLFACDCDSSSIAFCAAIRCRISSLHTQTLVVRVRSPAGYYSVKAHSK